MTRKFAVVGTGRMAATMMPAFRDVGAQVECVVSKDHARAAAFGAAHGVKGTGNLDEVLARRDIDAVYIATLPGEHAASIMKALRAGKAVLCEKPIAVSLEELHEIREVARQSGVLCMEGMWTLLLPAYRAFLADAKSGRFGEPTNLVASFGYSTAVSDMQTMLAPERGGVILDRGCYLIALALALFGPVRKVAAQVRTSESGIDTEAFLQLEHESGAHAQLAASFLTLLQNTATLGCTRGTVTLREPLIGSEIIATRAFEPALLSSGAAETRSLAAKLKSGLRRDPRLRALKQRLDSGSTRQASYGADALVPQLRHFLALLEAGKTESDVVPLSLSSDVLAIMHDARQSCGLRT